MKHVERAGMGQLRPSLPVRGRGLKLNHPRGQPRASVSLPVRGRGLKLPLGIEL